MAQRMQGRMDSPLTDQGKQHASTNGALIKSLGPIESIWASPSGRTTETAFLVNSHTQAQLEFAEELMERDCGEWSGQKISDIEMHYPDLWTARERDPYNFRPPDGENIADMVARVQPFLEDLFAIDWRSLALITHGVMSKAILQHFLGLGEIETARVRHPNDLVYRLTFNAQDIDTHHFIAGGDAREGLLFSAPRPADHPAMR